MLRRRSGFTLIELLVVTAVVAILAGILFPTFSRCRRAAQARTCVSNLRQIGMGLRMYVQDYDEHYPNPAMFCARVTNPLNANDTPGGSAGPGRWATWLFDIYPYVKNWDIFSCPSDAGLRR